MQLNPQIIRQSIENLKVQFPHLLKDEEAWLTTLESETDTDALLSDLVRRIDDTKAMLIGTKDRREELKAREDRFEQRIEAIRALLFKIMDAAELTKRELPLATLSIRAGQPQLVGDADPESVSPEYRKVSVALDRTAIKDALKTGQTVPGFQLSNSQPSLTIRIK